MGLKTKEVAEALRSIFGKPYTVLYPKTPSPPPETFRGIPEFDEKCIGCCACEQVCPAGAITFKDEGEVRKIEIFYGSCIRCGQCMSSCPVESIRLSTKYCIEKDAERMRSSIERKLVRCEECGTPIATEEHLRWILEKLGSLAFSNPTLIKFSQLSIEPPPRSEESHFRLLCPSCRRETVLQDHGWRAKY